MKKLITLTACTLLGFTAWAQKYVPKIKTGTVLNYTANVRAMGQTLPVTLTINQIEAPLRIKWLISGLGTGMYEITAKAIQSGNKMALREPGYEPVTTLKDNETIGFLSKDSFASLVSNKAFELNGLKFTVTEGAPAYVIDGKEADTFYAVSDNGKTKIWVLNNPGFPLVCKIEGSKQGIDLALNSVQ